MPCDINRPAHSVRELPKMASHAEEYGVTDYMKLMKTYLNREIEAPQYARRFFDFANTRVLIPNEEVDRIIQRAYGDADDYEPDETLRKTDPSWIDEPALRQKVAESLCQLETLGFRAPE
jgi:hypothetical protein